MTTALNHTDKLQLLNPFLLELETIHPVEAAIREWLVQNLSVLHIEKDSIILSEGEICKCLWVVLKGVIRAFHYVGETEVMSRLMKPHHIIISVESFYTQTPAFESLQAVQPAVLACLHYQQLDALYQQFPSFNYTGRRLTEHYLFLTERRLYLLRKQKAIDKYKFFLEEYPGLINEIPLKYIASFLGINGETLSRVRNKIR
jgi:CRP/FNR family transcriptional regulator, anaerobic regulatory protein